MKVSFTILNLRLCLSESFSLILVVLISLVVPTSCCFLLLFESNLDQEIKVRPDVKEGRVLAQISEEP